MRIPHPISSTFLLACIAAGCSSAPSSSEQFINLDYDSKAVFLTYYPYLSSEQRSELLTNSEKDPRELIQDWAGELNDPNRQVGSFDEMMNNPSNRKISRLEIKIDAAEPITAGDHIHARAFAQYANGNKVDVTHDTEWRVEPRLGRMNGNQLKYECVHSDVTIIGDFLGERDSTKIIVLRKPIQSLEIRLSEGSIGEDSGYNFQLALFAHCKDGSVSDVSCQANWKSVATGGKVEGCGNFIVTSKEKLAQDALTVSASYGDLSVRKTLRPPVR